MDEMNHVKTVQGRWMTIDEEIYDALDIHTMSLYTALRYEGDFAQETSKVIRSLKYLCDKAKIKRAQGFKSLNKLEKLGLIKRCNEKRLGEVGLIYVSKHLDHFCLPVHTVDTPVYDMDTPVHTVDTYQESLQESLHKEEKVKPSAAPDEYKVLKNHKIKCPKKPNQKVLTMFSNALIQLKEQEVTLDDYLTYLKTQCSDWLYIPWGDRQRTNDEISILLKPAIINDALAGKYEDKRNVARN